MEDIDYRDFFWFHIFIFKVFGFWKPDPKMKFKIIYNCYTVLCIITWILFLLSLFIYMYKNLNDVNELTAVLYLAGPFIVDLIKMLAIYIKMDFVKTWMKKLNQPMFQPNSKQHLQIAMATRKFHRNFFCLCLYLGMQTFVCFLILPFLKMDERTIPTQGWFPFKFDHSPNYQIVFVFQNAVVLWNDIICLNLDTFSSGLLMQIGMQCDYLCHCLNNLDSYRVENGILVKKEDCKRITKSKFSTVMLENLVVCIKHHKKIKRFSEEFEKIHKTSVFILFLGGGMIICSGLFQLSTVQIGSIQSFMLVSYTLCMLIEQFMYCWFGNQVIEKSSNIFNSAYNTPWIKCDKDFQKTLLQFMILTKYPIKIRVGGVLVMSNAVFVSINNFFVCAFELHYLFFKGGEIIIFYFYLVKEIPKIRDLMPTEVMDKEETKNIPKLSTKLAFKRTSKQHHRQ